jgi:hypothetical protein
MSGKVLADLIASCKGLYVDGENTPDAAALLVRPGGSFSVEQAPFGIGEHCVYVVSNYEWDSDTTHLSEVALDAIVFDKEQLLQAIQSRQEEIRLNATRIFDYGDFGGSGQPLIWPTCELTLSVDYEKWTLTLDFDRQAMEHFADEAQGMLDDLDGL